MELAKLIKDKRLKLGLSQQKVGQLSGLSQSHICKLENGSLKNITIEDSKKIASALELDPLSLLLTEPKTLNSDPSKEEIHTQVDSIAEEDKEREFRDAPQLNILKNQWTIPLFAFFRPNFDSLSEFFKAHPELVAWLLETNKLGEAFELDSQYRKSQSQHDGIQQAAQKYKTRTEFRRQEPSLYELAKKHRILDKVTAHMPVRASVKWTIETVTAEAAKYKSREEFCRMNASAASVARKLGILDTLHPTIFNRWTKYLVKKEAKKYKTRTEFKDNEIGAYRYALDHKMMDKLFPEPTKDQPCTRVYDVTSPVVMSEIDLVISIIGCSTVLLLHGVKLHEENNRFRAIFSPENAIDIGKNLYKFAYEAGYKK